MTVFRSLEAATGVFGPCAVAIGNFDGVHVGHQALLRATVAYAKPPQLTPAVLTFDPHPAAVVAPHRRPEMICTLEDRIRLLGESGAEKILVLPFTEELARMTPREFVEQILLARLETRAVFVGENFRFGCRQAGTPEVLAGLGAELGFQAQFLEPVVLRGRIVSSSVIRTELSKGNVSLAARLLNRCFSLRGPVVSGHGVGSRQTVPTLNMRPVEGLVSPRGVFVTRTVDTGSGRVWPSITNVGVRPTFGGDELTIETFLLTPLEGGTPRNIETQFEHFLRPERRFASAEELRAQIMQDVRKAQVFSVRFTRLRHVIPSIY